MDKTALMQHLKKVDFLKDLPGLEGLAKNCHVADLSPNDFLFKEGETAKSMFIISEGCLEVIKENRTIALRTEGEYIGEMALLGNQTRSASIKASSNVKAIEIKENVFKNFLSSNPEALLPLVKTLALRSKEELEILASDNRELETQKKINKRFNRILDDTINEIYILDPSTYKILRANLKASTNLGYPLNEFSAFFFNSLFSNFSWDDLNQHIQTLLKNEQAQASFTNQLKRKDGSTYPVEVRIQYLDTEEPAQLFAIVEDITAQKAMEEHIKQLAFYDTLTELPNRNLLKDRMKLMLAHADRRNKKFAVIYMDMDNFKAVNDNLGHDAGDQFLKSVTKRLTECLRKDDTLGRLSGDEFIILLPALKDEKEATQLAQKINDVMDPPFLISNKEIFSNFSIGISYYPDDGKDIATLLKNADIAMYRAKEMGGHTYQLFTASMNDKINQRMTMEQNLRKALENDELKLYYQPKVNEEGTLLSLEALIRWPQPDGKMISPGVFIPIAEESRIIGLLGKWVIIEACKKIKEWKTKFGQSIKIAVNVSGKQFEQTNLVNDIKEILATTKIDPLLLEIEVTETAVMRDIDAVIKILEELKELGVQSSIDDFGSGYTSLGYLKKFPVHSLKIDQSFIRGFKDKSNQAIIEGIITICKVMGLEVVAEGVETKEQLEYLKALKCDIYQGYFFYKPLPADEVAKQFFSELIEIN
jgi:diguanylate cyclase (GGDEF)-like protein/PAS domain S-box-containing protein